ncbi:MAG TPA: UDP-glucose 4-epimerase GalE [Bacteroidales bacterium]
MKIVVTGGTGFIGSHTVVELQLAGYEVEIIDDLSNSYAEVVGKIEQITGIRPGFSEFDICDNAKLQQFFANHPGIAGIIHFAASKAVGESVKQPLKYYYNNLVSLMNLLTCMLENGISNMVFSSSCTVYGQPDKLPVNESAPLKPAFSPYGNTKQIAEEILTDTIAANKRLKAIALRYFNPIGAHPSALIGELPIGIPSNLVPFITQTAIGKRESLRVFGDDYPTPDGTAIRDYIHVVDLAKAHVVAIGRLLENKGKRNFEIFNLGTGLGYSVMQVIKSFEKVTGLKLNYHICPRREGDIIEVWADTNYANEELGWKATKDIDEMITSAWKWELALKQQGESRG